MADIAGPGARPLAGFTGLACLSPLQEVRERAGVWAFDTTRTNGAGRFQPRASPRRGAATRSGHFPSRCAPIRALAHSRIQPGARTAQWTWVPKPAVVGRCRSIASSRLAGSRRFAFSLNDLAPNREDRLGTCGGHELKSGAGRGQPTPASRQETQHRTVSFKKKSFARLAGDEVEDDESLRLGLRAWTVAWRARRGTRATVPSHNRVNDSNAMGASRLGLDGAAPRRRLALGWYAAHRWCGPSGPENVKLSPTDSSGFTPRRGTAARDLGCERTMLSTEWN
jgi:hypothetical protein